MAELMMHNPDMVQFRNINGNNIPFTKEEGTDRGKPLGGQLKALGMESDSPKVKKMLDNALKDVMSPDNKERIVSGQKVTNFHRSDDAVLITKKMEIKDDTTGGKVKLDVGEITNCRVFAGKDADDDFRIADELVKRFPNTKKEDWKHTKGFGYVIDKDGNKRLANIHWIEHENFGQIDWKVKKYLE